MLLDKDTVDDQDDAVSSIPDLGSKSHLVDLPRSEGTEPPLIIANPTLSNWKVTFDSLKNRDFRLLWFGMVFMMGGFEMQMIAQGFLVYELTGSAKILGLVSGGWALPMLSLTLFGGAIADRIERKPIIQVGQGCSALVSLLVALSISTGSITWFYLLLASMFQGLLFAFTGPARQAIIPQIVGRKRITNAIALNSAAMSSMSLFAPIVAGILYATVGPDGVYYVMSGMWLTAVTLTTAIHKPVKMPVRKESEILGDIKAGLQYVLENRIILVLLGVMLATVLLAMPLRSLLPVFIVDVYLLESEAFGLLVSMIGLGSLIGALITASIGQWKRGLLVIIGGFFSGLALLLVALVPVYFAAVCFMILFGLGNIAPMALITALIMERAEEQFRGRMMSIVMLVWGLMPISVIPLGTAVDTIGSRETVGLMAAATLTVFSIVLISQKSLRQLQ